jgi:hypothetical protein
VEEAHGVVKTKRDFHEALSRNGYFLPPMKCGGTSIGYLQKVRA